MAAGLAGCQHDVADTDNAFYAWDGRAMHCAIDIDDSTRNGITSIETGLDRAKQRGEVLELFMHHPGETIGFDKIEAVLAAAQARDLPFVTYADMAHGALPAGTGGLALAFDDWYVSAWMAGRDLFQRYHARLTFFVGRYHLLQDSERADIAQLAADGHDIEAHSVLHARGPTYVINEGLASYMTEEVLPSIDQLRADGYEVTTFAYPFGARTDETDHAILQHVQLLRSVSYAWSGPETDPCPF